MGPSFFQPPPQPRYALRGANVPACLVEGRFPAARTEGLVAVDLLIDGGRIAALEPAGSLPQALGPDLDASVVLPGMVDCHTHLDKGHIWPRQPNPSGDGTGAFRATAIDRRTAARPRAHPVGAA